MYYRLQPIAILFGLIGVLFTVWQDNYNHFLVSSETGENLIVSYKNCRKRTGSSIVCSYEGEEYKISITREECPELQVGTTVKVIRNETLDYFFFPDKVAEFTRQVYLSICIFVMCLLPHKYFSTWNKT